MKIYWLIILIPLLFLAACKEQPEEKAKRYTILGLGDSITEGADFFQCYLFPLWEKLYTGGYEFEFIGPRTSNCRIGTLNHSGFSGKNAEYLDSVIDTVYAAYPADIVLLHTGHNHFDTENPVAGIVAAQESIIRKIKAVNPQVRILVAQVITSGKLPKYSYIPELNIALQQMVEGMDDRNVILVDQATGFNWEEHTVHDMVHPNEAGAQKMAGVWFSALQDVMKPAVPAYGPEIVTYKEPEQGELKLHIFRSGSDGEKKPAIVFFFGGGWQYGTPLQFYRECAYYASKGIVAVSAEYRISWLHKTTPFESFEDAKDVVCWLREHAASYGIDPDMIAAAGASAGGQLAAALGTVGAVSNDYRPDLLLLYYPVVDMSGRGDGTPEMKDRYTGVSPIHHIGPGVPPALFILGDKDPIIPVSEGEEFKRKYESVNTLCEFHILEGAGHPVFQYRKELTKEFYTIRDITDRFLLQQGYLKK